MTTAPDPETSASGASAPSPAWRNRIVGYGVEAPDQLVANARNWRIHPKAQQDGLRTVLKTVGWVTEVIVNRRTGFVVDGHARVSIALQDEEPEIPVKYVDLSEEEEGIILATLDPLSAMAGTDRGQLAALMADLPREQVQLAGLLGAIAEREKLPNVARERLAGAADDEVPALPKDPVTQLGDLWQIGPHRLLCGDATKSEDVARLMDGARADVVVTDPPYAIYGSSTGIAADITDDKMVRPFFRDVVRACVQVLKPFGHAYICCDWRSWPSWWEVAKGTGLVPKNCIVWDKGDFGLGNTYRMCHEFAGFFAVLPLRDSHFAKVETGQRQVLQPNVRRQNRTGQGGWESENEKGLRFHNAAKPVDLFRWFIENSTEEAEIVADFFGGAGTTILAGAGIGRQVRMMEIEPMWCDVILDRCRRVLQIEPELIGRAPDGGTVHEAGTS